jgi:hypothetical protein
LISKEHSKEESILAYSQTMKIAVIIVDSIINVMCKIEKKM